jgi:hypothetical protein
MTSFASSLWSGGQALVSLVSILIISACRNVLPDP